MYSEAIERALTANGAKLGDDIKLTKGEKSFEGVLMPRPETGDSNTIILKLSSGYNIGIGFDSKTRIRRLKRTESHFSFPKSKMHPNSSLPRVSLLYTGGTIGSKIDYVTGGVYMLTKPEELLHEVPELADIANVQVEHLMSVASEDISYIEWQEIAKRTADAINKGSKGIIITLGTDTMHYTSAALSFMLKDTNAPVVLTGAQRSSDRGSSDAFVNLICSAHLSAESDISEVGVCMHASPSDNYCNFIRGTKVRKMHTSRRDAFKPINNTPIARVNPDGVIEYLSDYRRRAASKKRASAVTKYEPRVALVKSYPNSDPGVLDYYVKRGYKGIVIETTGLGHAPVSTSHKEYNWTEGIKNAISSGLTLGITSQCLYGRVNDRVYRNARLMSNAGAIYCEDMLPEVAYVKLGFLLGNHKKKEAERLLAKNIAGEITERTELDWSSE